MGSLKRMELPPLANSELQKAPVREGRQLKLFLCNPPMLTLYPHISNQTCLRKEEATWVKFGPSPNSDLKFSDLKFTDTFALLKLRRLQLGLCSAY